ncbi:14646_t:CDS:2, partial [Racocetra persica]
TSQDPVSEKYQTPAPNSPTTSGVKLMQIDTIRYKPLGEPGHIAKNCFNKNNTQPKIGVIITPDELSGKERSQQYSQVKILALIDLDTSACFLDSIFSQERSIPFEIASFNEMG